MRPRAALALVAQICCQDDQNQIRIANLYPDRTQDVFNIQAFHSHKTPRNKCIRILLFEKVSEESVQRLCWRDGWAHRPWYGKSDDDTPWQQPGFVNIQAHNLVSVRSDRREPQDMGSIWI